MAAPDAEISRSASRRVALGLAALLLLSLAPAPGWAEPRARRPFLTGPSPEDPAEIARGYLEGRRALSAAQGRVPRARADEGEWRVKNRHLNRHNGITHLYMRRAWGGIELLNGDMALSVTADGRLIGLREEPRVQVWQTLRPRIPVLSASEAVERAAEHLGHSLSETLALRQQVGGAEQEVRLSGGGVSRAEIPAKLVYFIADDQSLRLAWQLTLDIDDLSWWDMTLDATTGEIFKDFNRVHFDSYEVFALPKESPDDGARTIEVNPAEPNASPFGWHDTNGSPGAEFTYTRGNNVLAQEDPNGNNDGGLRPDGGSGLDFSFPILSVQDPNSFAVSAAITNLFYWNNILHDIHYQYGFDEDAGNFQENNYGKGGLGSDSVNADALDGGGANNANFSVVPDGFNPRMQMFLFVFSPTFIISSPSSIADTYPLALPQFGPQTSNFTIAGPIVQAFDASDPNSTNTDACSAILNSGAISGNIALIDRGGCFFVDKVKNAQDAGAIAAVVVNNQGNGLVNMAGTDPNITIRSLFIGQGDGDLIKAQLGGVVMASFKDFSDSDFDNGVVIHEYGHGISTRLTGGASNHTCLGGLPNMQSRSMGEGWSDFWALALTAAPNDEPNDPRGVGVYATGDAPGGAGIRDLPYSAAFSIYPRTFADIEFLGLHERGTVWVAALWEVYWNLVDQHGFDADFYHGSGGNNLMLQLVMDGLKLQPCEPTYLEGRDAILAADQANNGGANQCSIWRGFAKRGMGINANDGGDPDEVQVTENFDLPGICGECGDLNDDGMVDADDVTLLENFMADPSTLSAGEQTTCQDHAMTGSCNILEWVILVRALVDLGPGFTDTCSAAGS